MSNLKNSRIKSYIEQNFTGLIDLSCVKESERPISLLTRGVAALAVMHFTGCNFQDAADSVVDGGGDNGIDAIYYDSYMNTVFFVQSKWSSDGNKTIDEAAAHKLVYGVQKLLGLDFDGFNENVVKKTSIFKKITDDASVKVALCPAYNSNNNLADSVERILVQYAESINEGDDIMRLEVANQSKLYEVASKSQGPINEDVVIRQWIKLSETAYYGLVAASDLARLFDKHQDSLFIPNIRTFKGDTDVNNGIVESLLSAPELFCYLNNGITLIANEVNKKLLGGNSHESGIFECNGLAVVNGAQTVGACNRAYKRNKEKTDLAYVIAKIIATTQHDSEFVRTITKAANTQNKIERKDFVATDAFQKELQEDLDILGVKYIYKTGEQTPNDGDYVDLTYVTQALIADTNDIDLIATAKREIGKIWDDIEKAPYKILFNPSNNAYYVRNVVSIFTKIQNEIKRIVGADKRKQQYLIYGNIFIAAQCLRRISKENMRSDKFNLEDALKGAESLTSNVFTQTYASIEAKYEGTPLVYFFRNTKKLKIIESDLLNSLKC